MHVTIISTHKYVIKVDNCKGRDEYPGADAIPLLNSPSDDNPFCGKRMKFLAHCMTVGLLSLLPFRIKRYVYMSTYVCLSACTYVRFYLCKPIRVFRSI